MPWKADDSDDSDEIEDMESSSEDDEEESVVSEDKFSKRLEYNVVYKERSSLRSPSLVRLAIFKGGWPGS